MPPKPSVGRGVSPDLRESHVAELLDPRTIRELAASIGLRPTKQRGQNFVTDANTVRRIVAKSGIAADVLVLEIGPGLGSLTLGLLETGAQVTAIEIEESLAQLLPETVKRLQPENAERLRVVHADALEITDLPGPQPSAVVANLPYNVAVLVLLHLLETFDDWRNGLVMVQLEVADRLVADPGSKVYGVPSAKVAWYAEARRVGTVPPTVFWPVPNVDSGLVKVTRREPPRTTAARETVFTVIDAAFAQRRKMLRSALSVLFGSSAAASEAISAAGVDPTARGEVLAIDDFARIAEQLTEVEG
ncbi:MAG: 16S rRNA (adenine(1518)-N(6)/adenine(1519)-N(6))-dimethyltransferase RsmA [Propionibacterium sp.]|nr:16S rRNA (adenine(1518)-N(6)/adenine(1519)-N(6))-dimethyltransferase RsmA [Propionibacterium sp.]